MRQSSLTWHGSLGVTGLFTWWLRAPQCPTFLKHFPINPIPQFFLATRKEYIKHQVLFTKLLISYKSQGKTGITTLDKKGKMTIKYRDRPVIIQINDMVTFKLRFFLYAIKITMNIKFANIHITIFL